MLPKELARFNLCWTAYAAIRSVIGKLLNFFCFSSNQFSFFTFSVTPEPDGYSFLNARASSKFISTIVSGASVTPISCRPVLNSLAMTYSVVSRNALGNFDPSGYFPTAISMFSVGFKKS